MMSRRAVVASAAAVSAHVGLDGPIAFAAPTSRPDQPFHAFKLGDARIVTVSDGGWEKPHDAGFIKNATVEDTKAALRQSGLPDANVPITFTVTFVEIGDRTIMFDAGTGGQLAPTAGKLATNMKAAGIDASKINTIVVTHFHPDHIFGLMAKDTNAQIYPDADIVVPEAEYKFWTDPAVFNVVPAANHPLAKRIQATLGQWKNVRRIADGEEVAPGVKAVAAHGHTPGHTVFHVSSGSEQMMNLADTCNIPALFARHPEWHAAFDADPIAAEATRRKLFDRVVADNLIMTGYHFGMPGAGRMTKDGKGYAFVPLAPA